MKYLLRTREVTWGGGESFLVDLADELRESGVDVEIQAPRTSELWRRGHAVESSTKPDVYLANDFRSAWVGWLRWRPRVAVFVCHGWWQTSPARNLVLRILSFRVLCLSSAVADAVVANGFCKRPPVVLHLGASRRFRSPEAAERSEARAGWGLTEDQPTLVWVGRFQDVKRIDLLLAAVRRARTRLPTLVCLVVTPGEGVTDQERLEQSRVLEAAAEADSGIRHLPGVDPLPAYWAADAYISTSAFESLGIAHLEAAACGLRLVSTAHPGPDDFMTPDDFHLDVDADSEQVAAALLRALSRGGRQSHVRESGMRSAVAQIERLL